MLFETLYHKGAKQTAMNRKVYHHHHPGIHIYLLFIKMFPLST